MFLVALKKSKSPLVWRTSHGFAVIAFPDEDIAHYFLSQYEPGVLRGALVLTPDQAIQRLPFLPTFYRLLVLGSTAAVDAVVGDLPAAERLIELRKSPWWVVPSQRSQKTPRFSIPLTSGGRKGHG